MNATQSSSVEVLLWFQRGDDAFGDGYALRLRHTHADLYRYRIDRFWQLQRLLHHFCAGLALLAQ